MTDFEEWAKGAGYGLSNGGYNQAARDGWDAAINLSNINHIAERNKKLLLYKEFYDADHAAELIFDEVSPGLTTPPKQEYYDRIEAAVKRRTAAIEAINKIKNNTGAAPSESSATGLEHAQSSSDAGYPAASDPLCEKLVEYIEKVKLAHPDYHAYHRGVRDMGDVIIDFLGNAIPQKEESV